MSGDSMERELLARFGLSDSAGPSEIEAAHADIVAFLETAPHDLQTWAKLQIASADESYALLSDPDALREQQQSAKAALVSTDNHAAQRRSKRPQQLPEPAPVNSVRARRLGPTGRMLIAATVLVATFTVGYMVYASDVPAVPGLSGTPAPEGTQPALDMARVGQLMEAIAADPNDVAALQELADIYFAAGDYETASSWEAKVLVVEPDNLTAHLALGASAYNIGNSADAATHWRRVLELDPQNVEAHYDLGFMYFSADPPDVDKTITEWRLVVEIAPESDIARTVSAHLATLEQWKSSASPAATGATTAPTSAPASPAPTRPASPVPTAEP